jgi:N-acetylneuraminic acid mutarotase
MKAFYTKYIFSFALLFICVVSGAQLDTTWRWLNGDYRINMRGIYSPISYFPYEVMPGSRTHSVSWTDLGGKLWLFGGYGFDLNGQEGNLNDLWTYTQTDRWNWKKGDNLVNISSINGTPGEPALSNKPGGRYGSASWTDQEGKLWLFGGVYMGGPFNNDQFYLNDLWKYDPQTNEWAWIKGDSAVGQNGIYGTLGSADVANRPGGRRGSAYWKDADGNFWLFGGMGYGATGGPAPLNDLWKYSPANNTWTWMKGASSVFQSGIYGAQGIPDAGNTPGSRWHSATWIDQNGALWLFGGNGLSETQGGLLNDLWKFDPQTGNWTWMKGSRSPDQIGVYGIRWASAETNIPGGREESYSWIDQFGRLWLFGGAGASEQVIYGRHNDLWMYQPSNNQWTWINGDSILNKAGVYNIGGIPNIYLRPGSRSGGVSWMGPYGAFYLFGGEGSGSITGTAKHNDLWMIYGHHFPLPVSLLYFRASVQSNTVTLQWATGEEKNLSQIHLQRSVMGDEYQSIASFDPVKTGVYAYTDPDSRFIPFERLFYRLLIVDIDETWSLSNVIMVRRSPSAPEIFILPNPVGDQVQLMINSIQGGPMQVRISDGGGVLVFQKQLVAQPGRNFITIPAHTWAAGIYFVQVRSTAGTTNQRLMKE